MRYPMSYFSSLLLPRRVFAQRTSLTVWQAMLTTVFLMSLLFIPVSLQVGQLESYPLERVVSGIYEPLTTEVIAHLQGGELRDGELMVEEATFPQVTFGDKAPETTGVSYHFGKQQLKLVKSELDVVTVPYQELSQQDFSSKEALSTAISNHWFTSNRFGVSLFLISSSCLILGTNFIFLVLGASGILFLASLTKWFDIQGFKQAYNLTLNSLGLPTVLAFAFGLTGQELPTIIMVQNILFVLVVVFVFFKTRFRDA